MQEKREKKAFFYENGIPEYRNSGIPMHTRRMGYTRIETSRAGRHFLSAKVGGCVRENDGREVEPEQRRVIGRERQARAKPPMPELYTRAESGYLVGHRQALYR